MEDGSDGTLSTLTPLPTDKKVNCISDENESNNSISRSTSTSNMANYPDNDLSEADNDCNKQQAQPEISTNYQQVATNINVDFDLSMSPAKGKATSAIQANGKTTSTDKADKEDDEFDNTSDNDVLVIDEERFSVIEDKNRDKIVLEKIEKSPGKNVENIEKVSKCLEDISLVPEHSNPYFSESIFELLNKKASVALPKKKSSGIKNSRPTQDRQTNKHIINNYAPYLGSQQPPQQMLKCARCNLAGFPTVAMLNDHLIKCGNMVRSFTGSLTGNVGIENLYNVANGLHKKVFLCSSCATYHTQADLFLHILHTHRRYVCLYCHGMFPGAERLARHLGNRHGACRYQKNHQEQRPCEQSYVNNNASLNNGGTLNVVRRGQDESIVGNSDNGGKTLDRKYGNMQEFRKGYKEECYLVCCVCERVFGGRTGARNADAINEIDDGEIERHVCAQDTTSLTMPSQLPQPTTPIVDNNNAVPTTILNPIEASHPHIVSQSIDNAQSLKSSITDSSNPVANAQIQNPVNSAISDSMRDAMQDIRRDHDNGDNRDLNMADTEDRSVDGMKEYRDEQAKLPSNISPNSNTILQPSSESNQPDTRKVPKVTLKLTKPYQPHSDFSDSDSYLSDENIDDNNDGNNDGNDSSDSAKLTMQVDEVEGGSGTVDDQDKQTKPTDENTENMMRLEGAQQTGIDGEQDADQDDNKVAQMDGGADEESTADGGKLTGGTIPDQSQQQAEMMVAGSDVPVVELEEMLEQPLDKMEPQSLLRLILLTSVPHCLYCNHARVIPVEGRQLVLHALSEHRYSATVRSITAEELIPESFNARLRECIPELRGKYFNLLNQPRDYVEETNEAAIAEKGTNKMQFECFQCRYQTDVHKELYQHNRKLHSKALLLCIMCKTSFLHYSELICHLCPGIYDVAPLLEPPEIPSSNETSGVSSANSALPLAQANGCTDENTYQSAIVAGGGNNSIGGIAVPDIRFRCVLCTKNKTDPLENKKNSVWELPSAFRLMVHLRKSHHLCDVCLEPCNTQQKLANHVWKHKLNHFCYRCGIAYRNKADITKHLYWKHGTESVDCRRCLLKRWPHVYHFCQPSAQFPCDECTLIFSRAMCLRVHKRLHLSTVEQQKPYMCTWRAEHEAELKQLENGEASNELVNDISENAGEDYKSETNGIKTEIVPSQISEPSKLCVNTSSAICGQRFVSRKMLRKHELKHREPKNDESEQVIVDEVDVLKDDIAKVNESTVKETEEQCCLTDQKSDILSSKEEVEAEESKVTKPKVDVYDLPALNLSESDSSETEDETETKKGVDSVELMKSDVNKVSTTQATELNKEEKANYDIEIAKKVPVLENIWENFKNYQKSQLDRQSENPSPSTSVFPMDEQEEMPILTDIAPPLTEEMVLRDHDYCRVTADTLIERNYTLEDDNTQISSVDHDYCSGAKESDQKKEENEHDLKNDSGAPQNAVPDKGPTCATNSAIDSDSSSCTCGSNCSCSSSSSTSDGEESSSSNDSSSDSSSSEGRRRQQAKREKKRQKKLISKGRKNSTNITTAENTSNGLNTLNIIVDVVDVVRREPVIQESDLETTELETDEDFYEEQPQRFALKLLAEKREKLLQKVDEDLQLNGSLLGSRPETPTSHTVIQNTSQLPPTHTSSATHSVKKSKKSKKKKKKTSRRKRNRSKSRCKSSDINPSHLYAQQYQQHLQYQQLVQRQQMERKFGREMQQHQSMGVVAPITLSLKQTAVNTMYGATPATAVGGMIPGQITTHGASNNVAAIGGSGSIYGQSGNSTPDDSNTRASKRRRVPNKFYGYSSDEEGNIVPANVGGTISFSHFPKWRKIDSPKRPRSTLVVPPITIKTIPPQVNTQLQQSTIPPLRIQHKPSSSSHNRPPRQFHPPNSKYRQRPLHSSTNKRINTSSLPSPNPMMSPSFHRLQNQHQRRPEPAPRIYRNDSSDDNESSSDDDDDEQQRNTKPQAQPVQVATVTVPEPVQQRALHHRKGFSLQLQQQQQQRMLNSAVSIGAGVRRGPTGTIVGAGAAAVGTTPIPAPGVALYCYCRCPYDEVSEMIGCDSDECAIEWFHFECVGIMVPPKGQWFCPDCRKRKQQRREMLLQLQQEKHTQH